MAEIPDILTLNIERRTLNFEKAGGVDAKFSIVIITKDTKELLENLLYSIQRDVSLQPLIWKIIVIDNASADATEEMVKEKFPAFIYVRNEKNMGFAFSVNKGASFAQDEYILFLNSDTILIPGELEKMVRFMDDNADVAICGPQLVYPDMKPQRSYAAIPSLSAEFFLHGKVQGSRYKVQGTKHETPTPDSPSDALSPEACTLLPAFVVDSLIGAAILVRRAALEKVGGFDERFFFFLEETDFCVRVCQAGYKVVFFPNAKIIHLQGKTVRKSWINGRIEYNISLHKFIEKHHASSYYNAFATVRFIKTLFPILFFPLVFFSQRMRLKYLYYLRLMKWYLKGCPDDMGLRDR